MIDFGVLWLLVEIAGMNYLLSNCLSFTASVIYNYILSTRWVFDAKENKNKGKEIFVFVLLSVIGLGINQAIMWLCVENVEIDYTISKIVATVIVMIYNFITRKQFLEGGLKHKKKSKQEV